MLLKILGYLKIKKDHICGVESVWQNLCHGFAQNWNLFPLFVLELVQQRSVLDLRLLGVDQFETGVLVHSCYHVTVFYRSILQQWH